MNNGLEPSILEARALVQESYSVLSEVREEMLVQSPEVNSPPSELNHRNGRPRFNIPVQQLQYLLDNRFTVPQMANLIGVSERTIHRRLHDNGLSVRSTFSAITDSELDEIVRSIKHQFPLCGNKQMAGHLTASGLRIQQQRIREVMRRVDPEGTVARRLFTVHRRAYAVPSPLSLWHMDGNHKLIR